MTATARLRPFYYAARTAALAAGLLLASCRSGPSQPEPVIVDPTWRSSEAFKQARGEWSELALALSNGNFEARETREHYLRLVEQLEIAAALDPKVALYESLLGEVMLFARDLPPDHDGLDRAERIARAEQAFRRSNGLNPEWFPARLGIARCASLAGNHTAALAILDEARLELSALRHALKDPGDDSRRTFFDMLEKQLAVEHDWQLDAPALAGGASGSVSRERLFARLAARLELASAWATARAAGIDDQPDEQLLAAAQHHDPDAFEPACWRARRALREGRAKVALNELESFATRPSFLLANSVPVRLMLAEARALLFRETGQRRHFVEAEAHATAAALADGYESLDACENPFVARVLADLALSIAEHELAHVPPEIGEVRLALEEAQRRLVGADERASGDPGLVALELRAAAIAQRIAGPQ